MTDRILVTGGAGFLGSHLCHHLINENQEVICLDNFGSGQEKNIKSLKRHPSFTIVSEDVRHPGSLPNVDKIYHLASRASPADFTEFPVGIALANTKGTRRMLDHARACEARMVFTSTSEIYGDPEVHPQPETYNGNVNIRGARGCYDESKRFGETLIESYQREYNMDTRTVRVFNTYGPKMRPDDGRVIPTFLTQALRGDDLTINGDGKQTRTFCYVDDLIEGITSLMAVENPKHRVYNLGNENEKTIKELARKVLTLVDSDSGITYEPLPEDDPSKRRPDTTRAKTELDWNPDISLEDGLTETIEYFKRNYEPAT